MVKRKTLAILAIAAAVFIFLVALLTIPFPSKISYMDKIAVVRIAGTISSSSSLIPGETVVTPDTVISLLEKAEEDVSVKAILLEINTGGGGPVACDEIAAKIKSINKTVVAWISDIGASGGYWIASSADKIIAHPLSITCSIGAYSILSDWTELFNKTGMNFTVIKSGEFKAIGSFFDKLTHEDEEIFQKIVDSVHETFIETVAENRGMSYNSVLHIADGRPCLGKDALDYGLVDALGNKQDAVELAEELAGIEDAEIIVLKQEAGFLEALFETKLQNLAYTLGAGIGSQVKEKPPGSVLVQ